MKVLVFFLSIHLMATTYRPISIELQVRESDAIIQGAMTEVRYKRLPQGEIVTEYTFQLKKVYGIPLSDIVHYPYFSILVPGGVWEGMHSVIHGSPEFKNGESVIVLLAKEGGRFWPLNLGLGKYRIKRVAGKNYVVSSLFPKLIMEYEQFHTLVSREKKGELQEMTLKRVAKINRKPSGFVKKQDDTPSTLWSWVIFIILLLGSVGLIYVKNR